MAEHDQYFDYLQRRSRLGVLYRMHWMFPRIARELSGTTIDVGCGVGDMLKVRPGTIGLDINPRLVDYCKKIGLDARNMEPDCLPLEDGSVDSALLDNVLEHIAQPRPLLSEIHRVVRPGGAFVVGVPGLRGWESDPDHKIYYDKQKLVQTVESSGFRHRRTFFMPWFESEFLARHLRQYFVYAVFSR